MKQVAKLFAAYDTSVDIDINKFLEELENYVYGMQPVSNAEISKLFKKEKKLKFTYKEQKEYETIESDIADLEEKIENLENSMSSFARDFVKLNQIVKEKEEAEALLEEKMDRWMYLEDLKARIDAQ